MRTLSGTLQTKVDKIVTDPLYLVEIQFSAWAYWSSREEVTVTTASGSHTFLPDRLLSCKPAGATAAISLENGDRLISAAALTGQIKGNGCVIYICYGGEVIQKFIGEIVAFTMQDTNQGARIDFELEAKSVLEQTWPFTRISKALGFNHLPQPGLSFTYGVNRYTLEASK
jgi:hypothetical protein